MMKKVFFSLVIVILTFGSAAAQNASVKGKVWDEEGKVPLELATVRLMQEGSLVIGAITDRRGEFSLSPISSGTYDLIVTFAGYGDYKLEGLIVRSNETKIVDDIPMSTRMLEPTIVKGKKELFIQGDPNNTQDIGSEELRKLPSRDVNSALATMSGVTQDGSGNITVRANREPPQYMVDGIPTGSVPSGAIGSLTLVSGSLPPEYGDVSSVVEIETKGPTSKPKGDILLSTFVDGNESISIDAAFTGPIVKSKKASEGKQQSFSMGYMIGLSARYYAGAPLWKGYYRASQETIDYLKLNPFRATDDLSSAVVARNVDYVTKYQEGNILSLEEKRARILQNVWGTSVNIRPKIDIRTPMNMDFSVGGRFTYNTGRSDNFANTLFNSENNSMSDGMSWELNARFTHKFGLTTKLDAEGKPKQQIIRNAFYRLTGYYIHSNSNTYNHIHKNNLFDYGYIGTFDHVKVPFYERGTVIDPKDSTVWEGVWKQTAFQNIAVNFTPSELNRDMARYTVLAEERFGGTFTMDEYIQQYKGLLNGREPDNIYSIFSVPGLPSNTLSKSLQDKIGGKAIVSFEIRDHAIRFGFDYDQTTSRYHGINPRGLWTMMRQLANSHIMELDFDSPDFLEDEYGVRTGYVNYPRMVDENRQTTFDRNLRRNLAKQMGVSVEDIKDLWIDVDSYEPSWYDLNWFSAEELFNGGSEFNGNRGLSISYYGYDYTGKRAINRSINMSNIKDWFDEANPNSTRNFGEIGAFKPIKMAAYIQDKFSIQTLYVMLGLRLDIFNANQPCVKDMYLYREAMNVGEARNLLGDAYIPENSNNYYVYVKDPESDVPDIVAFRDGNRWYNKRGEWVSDPDMIIKEEGIPQLIPYFRADDMPGNSDITKVNWKAFQDYTPTFANGGVTLSPRIAFSFAVGVNSQFSASYNVITSWSSAMQRFNPISYLFFEKNADQGSLISNPGLKPERSVNYEIGFKQLINRDMSMEFVAYYSERKDQVVAYQYSQAYPRTYISYTNMDFGTVQGFILGLNMRAGEKGRTSFRTNYTLQFAKGTGSDPTSTLSLLRSGQPNLRTLTTLNDDQRHRINLVITYGFGPKDGPKKMVENKKKDTRKEIWWLQNAGATLDLGVGSGRPYTRSNTPYSQIISNAGTRVVEGAINGSRMPWTIYGNLVIRKGFAVVLKKEEGNKDKMGMFEVALAVRNIIGYRNQTSVYSYSGSRMDDGFLTAKEFQQYINNQENPASFIDYYTIRMEGLNPYGTPRVFELQLTFSF